MHLNKKFSFGIITLFIFFIGLTLPLFVFAAEPCKELSKDSVPVKFFPQITIPGTIFDKTKSEIPKGKTEPPGVIIDCNSISQMASDVYKFIAGIAGIAAVIVMMAGGYVWLFAGGNASKVTEAKSLITSAVLGLVLVLGSYMILNLINPELIKLKSLDDIAGIKPISTTQTGNGASPDSSAAISCPPDIEELAREKSGKDEGCGLVVSAKETKSSQSCMRVSCLAGSVCILNMEGELFSVFKSGCVKQITALKDGVSQQFSAVKSPLSAIKCGEISGDWSKVYSNECGGDPKYTSCAIRTSGGDPITEEGGGTFFSHYQDVVSMKCERDDI